MTDSSGLVQAHYEYDLYGQRTKTAGALDSDFQYAGYYMHAPSGLNLTVYRAYNPALGRWINRDPIAESGGLNLYRYALARPTGVVVWANQGDGSGPAPPDGFTPTPQNDPFESGGLYNYFAEFKGGFVGTNWGAARGTKGLLGTPNGHGI